jgi:predicted neuraminidase
MSSVTTTHPCFIARYVSQPDDVRPSAHGSTICELPSGELLASWYGGTREYGLDVSIMGARLPRGARQWEPLGVWADVPQHTMGNPVLFPEPDGPRLWLFYVVLYGDKWTSGKIHYRHSTDGGATWGPQHTLTEELGHMTRNKVHRAPGGAWLLPLYDERDWSSYVLISSDRGATWQRSTVMRAPYGVIQPTVVPAPDGRLLALMRTGGRGGLIWRAHSTDGGHTWSEPAPTPLPNPNAACDAAATPGGTILLAFNNTPSGRAPLNVALSDDGGETWPRCRAVETAGGEYSYPALIHASDGLFHLTYTYRRTHIKHVTFDEAWLRAATGGAP